MAADKTYKNYSLSKTKVREMIEAEFGEVETVSLAAVLALFDGKSTGSSTGSTTLVYNDNGEVIAKRCSYFGVFFDIAEFGKRGDTYSYQSKLAESLVRKARTAAINEKKLADEELADEVIDVAQWKARLAEIEVNKEARVEITEVEDALSYYNSAEDAKVALA